MKIKNIHKNIYAKTMAVEGRNNVKTFSVFGHCLIVGIVAREFAKYIENRKGENFEEKYHLSEFAIHCARHDIGKASPGFQYMLGTNTEENPKYHSIEDIDRVYVRDHANISAEYLIDQYSTIRRKHRFISALTRWHHGCKRDVVNNTLSNENGISSACGNDNTSPKNNGVKWNSIRREIDDALKNIFGDGEAFSEYIYNQYKITGNEDSAICHEVVKYLTGFLSVCDWIASDEANYPPEQYANVDEFDYDLIANRAKEIIENIGLEYVEVINGFKFGDIFKGSDGTGYTPNWIQENIANIIDSAGVYVVEAGMGSGKTEAALYGAYSAMEKGIVNGIYFAMPTQVTSNSIFDRFDKFIQACSNANSNDIRNVHGKSAMLDEMSKRHSWFNGNKRGLLAQFGVGTVDQSIVSVMGGIKHFYIRTFGLANKCIIIDEVHSYDLYTGTLINEMISQLSEFGCVIIVLSATLTANVRAKICKCEPEKIDAYPLIYKSTKTITAHYSPTSLETCKEIHIRRVAVGTGGGFGRVDSFMNGREQIIAECQRRAANGEIVLWIENSVGEAQRIFDYFRLNCNFDKGLLHSKFTNLDRAKNEEYWISRLGKGGDRSTGCVLVSTQVCEQSVDIDADFLVTALCPTDMMFQRIGRLHRHSGNLRKSKPECVLLYMNEYGEMEYQNIKNPISLEYSNRCGVSTIIYEPAVLRSTHFVWENIKSVQVPNDIRSLIESTYNFSELRDSISQELIKDMNRENNRKAGMASQAKVRYSGIATDINDGFSDDKSSNKLTLTRDIQNSIQEIILCSQIASNEIITLHGDRVNFKRLNNEDLRTMEESSLKINIDDNKLQKNINIFREIEGKKHRKLIVVEIKDGVAIDSTTGKRLTNCTYDERGFKFST